MIMLETERLVSANFNWSERVVKVLKMFQAKVSHNFIIFWTKVPIELPVFMLYTNAF